MQKRYIVIDQNVLRKSVLEALLIEDPAVRCVLPDLAFLEMTKTPEWESTLRRSLQILSRFSARVHVCISVNEALAMELKRLEPVTNHMLSLDSTNFVRDLLESVRTGRDGWAFGRIRQNPEGHLQELAKDHLQHDDNKARVGDLIEATRTMVSDELQKRMRAGKVTQDDRLLVLRQIGVILLPKVLASRGFNANKARAFMRKKPLLLRFFYLKAWRCLTWIEKGGFGSLPPKAVTNEEIDNQYILSATMFQGLLSEEKSANYAYQDLLGVLSQNV